MKTNILTALLALLFLASCSDDEVTIEPSDFSYSIENIDVPFYTDGQSGSPIISWNGSLGTFGLDNSYEGVSINSTSGIISWNKNLGVKTTTVNVIATNANGNISTTVNLTQKLSGSFTGGYNNDINSTTIVFANYNLTFSDDGTLTVNDDGGTGSGTWSIDDFGNLTGNYNYDGSLNTYYVAGELTYSSSQNAKIIGLWGGDENNLQGGYIELDLD